MIYEIYRSDDKKDLKQPNLPKQEIVQKIMRAVDYFDAAPKKSLEMVFDFLIRKVFDEHVERCPTFIDGNWKCELKPDRIEITFREAVIPQMVIFNKKRI